MKKVILKNELKNVSLYVSCNHTVYWDIYIPSGMVFGTYGRIAFVLPNMRLYRHNGVACYHVKITINGEQWRMVAIEPTCGLYKLLEKYEPQIFNALDALDKADYIGCASTAGHVYTSKHGGGSSHKGHASSKDLKAKKAVSASIAERAGYNAVVESIKYGFIDSHNQYIDTNYYREYYEKYYLR